MSDTIPTYVADHELATLLKAAAEAGKRVQVEAEDEMFELEVHTVPERDSIWKDYDPDAVREALHALRGSLKDVDPDELIRQIKEDREQDPTTRKFV